MTVEAVTIHFKPYHHQCKDERENPVIYQVLNEFFDRSYHVYHDKVLQLIL